ncbi:MAG: alpha/beta fold hydrolase [Bacteroidetes bacterium]|nr:alpha/beta fold hydrolase [Bacteroidota bacterium]
MPVINSSFSGNRFCNNGHAETIIPALFRKVEIAYKRERMTLADGDFIDLDWQKKGSKKVLVLFHGLEGSSQSQYIKGFSRFFYDKGFDTCAVNFRSCSGEINKLLCSYNSGVSDDIEEVLFHVSKNNLYDEMYLCGFSLGGNALLKYLGEQSNNVSSLIKRAAAFSVPIDLAASSKVLASQANKVYMQRFLNSLNTKIKQKSLMFPGSIDVKGIEKIKTFGEWDSKFTAPIHGYKDSSDYYAKCNALQFLPHLGIPTLLVNSKNDPFLSASCFPYKEAEDNAKLYFEAPIYGGHVGFSISMPNGHYWSEKKCFDFFVENNFI